MDIVWFLLIGVAAGWLASQIMKGGGSGLVGSLVTATVGAIVLIAGLRAINRPRI